MLFFEHITSFIDAWPDLLLFSYCANFQMRVLCQQAFYLVVFVFRLIQTDLHCKMQETARNTFDSCLPKQKDTMELCHMVSMKCVHFPDALQKG